ncbi:penicillin-binding transpeptidase domain-containing protein [Fictibacillus sp. Mic-4]|uniref:penicillin-binding transpeptidase domain-containing protein n=1 Tax=Fictibacillus sp. Mic-4 TaxID=3132826 RepID=UPI003CEBF01A
MRRLLVAAIGVLLACLITGCSKEPSPEDHFKQYISSWEKAKYGDMYTLLSSESKKTISKDDFIERYKGIYGGIEAKNVTIKPLIPKKGPEPDKNNAVSYPYEVKMDTLAGPVHYKQNVKLVKSGKGEKENWYIQWDESQIFPPMKKGDKVRAETYEAKRGEIFDRNGKGLAINGTVYQVGIVPQWMKGKDKEAKQKMAKILEVSVKEIDQKLKASWVRPDSFVPIKTVSKDDPAVSKLKKIDGVAFQKTMTRVYPLKNAAAHLVGYIRPVNAEELKKLKSKGYTANDWVGKAGLEQLFEKRLRGENGGIITIVDKNGNKKDVLAEKQAADGKPLKLTIDATVQNNLYGQMKKDAGTASAINPSTGDVLALVSSPSYDPNLFVLGLSQGQYEKWNNDPKKPLLNRFKQTYAPGSTFKPITAAIGLKTSTINPNEEKTINGLKWQKNKSWGDHYVTRVSDVSPVNLKKALVYSDNIYFAQAALAIGSETFEKEAKAFGLGEKIPFDYPIEPSSLISGEWSEGRLADTGYGQGQVEMSILHLALSYTPFVNEGNLIAPRLVIPDKGEEAPTFWKKDVMPSGVASTIRNDLVQVVKNPHGTAHDGMMADVPLAGKTGTAELKMKQGEKGKENGWYVAFNNNHPELLIAMMIENVENKRGSHYVVPKVTNVFQSYHFK